MLQDYSNHRPKRNVNLGTIWLTTKNQQMFQRLVMASLLLKVLEKEELVKVFNKVHCMIGQKWHISLRMVSFHKNFFRLLIQLSTTIC